MPAGCGPRHLALHPSGEVLYVDHALNGSISALRYDAREGRITELLMRAQGGFGEALAMHPTGNFLYSASKGEVTVWRVEVATAALQKMQSQYVETDEVRGLSLLADGSSISVLTSNGVLRLDIGANSGYLGNPVLVASVPQVRSIAI
jgi:6-phosphogluconolactonase